MAIVAYTIHVGYKAYIISTVVDCKLQLLGRKEGDSIYIKNRLNYISFLS